MLPSLRSIRPAVLAAGLLWQTANGAGPALNLPAPAATQSRSGQFIVHPVRAGGTGAPPLRLSAGNGLIQLDPAVLTVVSERLKATLLQELELADQWRGKVHLALVPGVYPDQKIVVASTRFGSGWQYHVELPDTVGQERFVRALVQVLLLEIAGRSPGAHPAEVPLWLAEGLTQVLMTSRGESLLVQPGHLFSPYLSHRNEQKTDPFRALRQRLQQRAALTFDELSWPESASLSGEAWEIYRGCAHLFVHELLRLKDGRACLRDFLGRLPAHLNWQAAFFGAYHKQFPSMLDVEKWWAVHVVNLTGRSEWQTWPMDAALDRLDRVFEVDAQVRRASDQLPERARLRLPVVIEQWDYNRHRPIVRGVIQQLDQMRVNLPAALVTVADAYRATLEKYLATRDRATRAPDFRGRVPPDVQRLARETAQRLRDLDARRDQARGQAAGNQSAVSALSRP